MKVIISGSSGKMGKMIREAVIQAGYEIAAVAAADNEKNESLHRYSSLNDVTEEADVLIDFSHHSITQEITDFIQRKKMPAVIGTTGQTDEEKELIMHAAESVPVFFTSNLSIGIAVLRDLVKRAAAFFPDADIEIVEKHHNQKLDVPSGTALMLADAVREVRPDAQYNIGRHENGRRKKNEIGIHSLRMGSEVGTHEVYINTGNECLTLTHEAESRAVFADGALKAAEFIIKQPAGLYTMKELLG